MVAFACGVIGHDCMMLVSYGLAVVCQSLRFSFVVGGSEGCSCFVGIAWKFHIVIYAICFFLDRPNSTNVKGLDNCRAGELG